jgi:chromate reductase
MSKAVRILGIAGSLGRESDNRAVLRAASQLAPEDASIDIFEVDDIPLFNEDDEHDPPTRVVELKDRIREADAILFVTPENNYSIPGVLKNAIDWVSGDNPWSGKPAAVMGASTSALDTARAQYHMRQVMVSLNMFPLNQPEVMVGAANESFDTVEKLTAEQTREYVGLLVQSLVDWTRRTGKKEKADGDYNNEMLFAFV